MASTCESARASAFVATTLAAAVRTAVNALASMITSGRPWLDSYNAYSPTCDDRPTAGLPGYRLSNLMPKHGGSPR